jgi:hypothetical protein
MPKLSLKKVFEAAAADPKRKFFALEMFEEGGDLGPAMGAGEVEVPEAMSTDDQLREAFKSLILSVLDDTSLSLEEMGDKIVALLTVQEEADEALSGGSSGGSGDGSGSGSGSESAGGDSDKKEKPAAESLAQQGAGAGSGSGSGSASAAATAGGTDRSGALLESVALLNAAPGGAIQATPTVLESMAALPSKEKRQAFVAEMAANRTATGGGTANSSQGAPLGAPGSATVPRSAAPPATGTVAETAAPDLDAKYKEAGSFTQAVRGVA